MIMVMDKGKIGHVFPYIGVSKLSCIVCIHYIDTFNKATNEKITTKGSQGKAYPGWSWPELPDRDEELRPAFMKRVVKQLEDLEVHARRLSDSGSGFPRWAWDEEDEGLESTEKQRALAPISGSESQQPFPLHPRPRNSGRERPLSLIDR